MKHNVAQILDFLLTADFNRDYGYSYSQLLEFLRYYQANYKQLHQERECLKRELNIRDNKIVELDNLIKNLQNKVDFQEHQNIFLKTKVNRKLTFWERLTGKITF